MQTSNNIYSLIPKIMSDIGVVEKAGFNQLQKYKFRSIDDIYNSLQPQLANHGVFIVPNIVESREEHFESKNGTQQVRVKMKVKYSLFASDGSFVDATVEGEGIDSSDKATNKAFTAAFKYMAIQVFCLATDNSDDSDKFSPQIESKPTQPPPNNNKPIGNVSNPFVREIKKDTLKNPMQISGQQASALWGLVGAKRIKEEEAIAIIKDVGGATSTASLTIEGYDKVMAKLKEM